jgi:hypothetical protein
MPPVSDYTIWISGDPSTAPTARAVRPLPGCAGWVAALPAGQDPLAGASDVLRVEGARGPEEALAIYADCATPALLTHDALSLALDLDVLHHHPRVESVADGDPPVARLRRAWWLDAAPARAPDGEVPVRCALPSRMDAGEAQGLITRWLDAWPELRAHLDDTARCAVFGEYAAPLQRIPVASPHPTGHLAVDSSPTGRRPRDPEEQRVPTAHDPWCRAAGGPGTLPDAGCLREAQGLLRERAAAAGDGAWVAGDWDDLRAEVEVAAELVAPGCCDRRAAADLARAGHERAGDARFARLALAAAMDAPEGDPPDPALANAWWATCRRLAARPGSVTVDVSGRLGEHADTVLRGEVALPPTPILDYVDEISRIPPPEMRLPALDRGRADALYSLPPREVPHLRWRIADPTLAVEGPAQLRSCGCAPTPLRYSATPLWPRARAWCTSAPRGVSDAWRLLRPALVEAADEVRPWAGAWCCPAATQRALAELGHPTAGTRAGSSLAWLAWSRACWSAREAGAALTPDQDDAADSWARNCEGA